MKKIIMSTAVCAICLTVYATNAKAESMFDAHKWQLRLRGINVVPSEDSTVSNGGKINIENYQVPELDITYYFTDNIAAELVLATAKHKVREASPNIDLGHVWLLPPTLTAQYHFNNNTAFKPYVGAGINYTVFYNADPGAATSIRYDNGFGYALQAGLDYKLDENWLLNADVKKLYLNTDVKVSGGVTADVDIDPWIFGLGVGYRF